MDGVEATRTPIKSSFMQLLPLLFIPLVQPETTFITVPPEDDGRIQYCGLYDVPIDAAIIRNPLYSSSFTHCAITFVTNEVEDSSGWYWSSLVARVDLVNITDCSIIIKMYATVKDDAGTAFYWEETPSVVLTCNTTSQSTKIVRSLNYLKLIYIKDELYPSQNISTFAEYSITVLKQSDPGGCGWLDYKCTIFDDRLGCIEPNHRCDGTKHCSDNSDEAQCDNTFTRYLYIFTQYFDALWKLIALGVCVVLLFTSCILCCCLCRKRKGSDRNRRDCPPAEGQPLQPINHNSNPQANHRHNYTDQQPPAPPQQQQPQQYQGTTPGNCTSPAAAPPLPTPHQNVANNLAWYS